MLGGVSLRRGEALSTGRSGHRLPACETEACAPWQPGVALGAHQRETGAALHTEVRLGRILLLTPGTRHAVGLQSLSRRMLKGCPERSCAAGAGQGEPRVNRQPPVRPLNSTFRPILGLDSVESTIRLTKSTSNVR